MESRDNEDQDAIVESRNRLLAALDESLELGAVMNQPVRLLTLEGPARQLATPVQEAIQPALNAMTFVLCRLPVEERDTARDSNRIRPRVVQYLR